MTVGGSLAVEVGNDSEVVGSWVQGADKTGAVVGDK